MIAPYCDRCCACDRDAGRRGSINLCDLAELAGNAGAPALHPVGAEGTREGLSGREHLDATHHHSGRRQRRHEIDTAVRELTMIVTAPALDAAVAEDRAAEVRAERDRARIGDADHRDGQWRVRHLNAVAELAELVTPPAAYAAIAECRACVVAPRGKLGRAGPVGCVGTAIAAVADTLVKTQPAARGRQQQQERAALAHHPMPHRFDEQAGLQACPIAYMQGIIPIALRAYLERYGNWCTSDLRAVRSRRELG